MTRAIDPLDLRVPEVGKVDLGNWPTHVKRLYGSKKEYHEPPGGQVAEPTAQQRLHRASDGHAVAI